ncbi:MAG: hypothetical protein LBH60_06570 [Prevotellaceae bacterium]|jgi:hypothetical protein|nr:hypothetical protein [Prevotellaceae bacterium]
MFGYIKNILKNRCLKKATVHAKKRKNVAYNFETAKTMGVVYPFDINMGTVVNVLNDIAKRYNIEIVFLIYFQQERLPEGIGENSASQIFLSDNECNWFGKPNTVAINSFINTEFNLFVDLSSKFLFPLQYIAVSSNADFKIGRINDEINSPYNFVLVGSLDEEQFFKDLEDYLYKIK